MTTEVAPEMGLGTPFSDHGCGDAKGIKCQTELYREMVQALDRLVYEGYFEDRSHAIHRGVEMLLDEWVPRLKDSGNCDTAWRLHQMRRRSQFIVDRNRELEQLPDLINAAYTELLAHCDHKMLAEQITGLWDEAQARHDYWREQITGLFRSSPVLSGSVACLHRVGWPLPGDLVTHVLGLGTVAQGGGVRADHPVHDGADAQDDLGDAEGEVLNESERQPADRDDHQTE